MSIPFPSSRDPAVGKRSGVRVTPGGLWGKGPGGVSAIVFSGGLLLLAACREKGVEEGAGADRKPPVKNGEPAKQSDAMKAGGHGSPSSPKPGTGNANIDPERPWLESLDDRIETRAWRDNLRELSASSKDWETIRWKLGRGEYWLTSKQGLKDRILKLRDSTSEENRRAIDTISRYEVERSCGTAALAQITKKYPHLAQMSEADAKRVLTRWGGAAGLPSQFADTVLHSMRGRGNPALQAAPNDSEYETALSSQSSTVDSYFRDAIEQVLEMADHDGYIKARAPKEVQANRDIYSDWFAKQVSKPNPYSNAP